MSSTTLRLSLVARPGAMTAIEASVSTDADGVEDRGVTLDPARFGIPASLTGQAIDDSQFRIPEELDDLLASALQGEAGPEVLWLQLVEPFGYLGLVPWERLLMDRFGARVLRLPSLALARRRPRDSLQVTILVAVPNRRRSSDLAIRLHGKKVAATARLKRTAYGDEEDAHRPNGPAQFSAGDVDRLVRAVLRGSPRTPTTVNVVTTPWIYHDLKARWRGRGWPDWPVRLHDAYELREEVQRSTDRGALAQTPWLRTLEAAQSGEQTDVVHVVCHASVTDASTRLVMADPLRTSTNVTSRYVSLHSLMATLDEVGAWALCLTAPAPPEMGPQLRYVASRLAELRPGPILMTDSSRDPGFRDVEAGYRFLFSHEASAMPGLRDGLISCEPSRVAAAVPEASALTSVIEPPPAEQPRGAAADLMAGDSTPMWLAAAQRFVEQRQVELARLEQDNGGEGLSPEAEAIARGVRRAITTIQEVLEAKAQRSGGPDG